MATQALLKSIRIKKGISQKELAVLLGVSQQQISKMESRKGTSVRTLEQYAEKMGYAITVEPKISRQFETSYLHMIFEKISRLQDVVISHIAALEALGLFSGYSNAYEVEYYSEQPANVENTIFHPVSSLQEIGMVRAKGTYCTDINRTFNDVLTDCDRIDDTAILEALNTYYYENGQTFDKLLLTEIARKNLAIYAEDAIDYCKI